MDYCDLMDTHGQNYTCKYQNYKNKKIRLSKGKYINDKPGILNECLRLNYFLRCIT